MPSVEMLAEIGVLKTQLERSEKLVVSQKEIIAAKNLELEEQGKELAGYKRLVKAYGKKFAKTKRGN